MAIDSFRLQKQAKNMVFKPFSTVFGTFLTVFGSFCMVSALFFPFFRCRCRRGVILKRSSKRSIDRSRELARAIVWSHAHELSD